MAKKPTQAEQVAAIYEYTKQKLIDEPFTPTTTDPKILKILLNITKEVKKLQNQVMVLERKSYE